MSEVILKSPDLKLLTDVDDVMHSAVMTGDLTGLLEFGRTIKRGQQIQGLAAAKLLYMMKDRWHLFQAAGVDDNFEDVVFAEIGYTPQTTSKYVRAWESLFENSQIPDETKMRLMGKPIKWLLRLPAAIADLDDEDKMDDFISKVANAASLGEIQNLVRGVRGVQTSAKNRIIIRWDKRDGRLTAIQGDGTIATIGYMNAIDSVGIKAVRRIIDRAGIVEV